MGTPVAATGSKGRLVELALALADSYLSDGEAIAELRRAGDMQELAAVHAWLRGDDTVGTRGGARAEELVLRALPVSPDHLVAFYEDDRFLIDAIAAFADDGLRRGETVLVVVTAEHRAALEVALTSAGHEVGTAGLARLEAGRSPGGTGCYLAIDAADRLATLVHDGVLDVERFHRDVGGWLDELTADGGRVRVYGEMVALLWGAGHLATALQLEDLWNDLIARYRFPVLCGYPMRGFDDDETTALFHTVCERHTGVTTESYTPLAEGATDAPVYFGGGEAGGRPVNGPAELMDGGR
jgi:hypothetical protein